VQGHRYGRPALLADLQAQFAGKAEADPAALRLQA